jgi:hypothetical protein
MGINVNIIKIFLKKTLIEIKKKSWGKKGHASLGLTSQASLPDPFHLGPRNQAHFF